jgi:hypothetical protein
MAKTAAAVIPEPTLLERIAALHAEIDALIEAETDKLADPLVPRDVMRNLLLARAIGGLCRCRWAKALHEKDGAQ